MRRLLFFSLCLSFIVGCKKNSSGNDTQSQVKPEDAPALSKTITVWHGKRETGNAPAPTSNSNSPVLDPQSNNQNIKAIAGRYAIVKPAVIQGNVAGYYLKVQGAPDYFKVDYSKPVITGGRYSPQKQNKKQNLIHRIFGLDSTGGNLDSSIVISIPSTIQPGEFCITYWVYDAAGNISNPITACIIISSFGGDASVSYLTGPWHLIGQKYDTAQIWDPVLYMDTITKSYTCVNNKLTTNCPTSNCNFSDYLQDISGTTKSEFQFATEGGMKYELAFMEKTLNTDSSTCSNPVYSIMNETDSLTGAWSYTKSTNKLVMVFDFNGWGQPEPEAYEFTVDKINDKLIYLHNAIDRFSLRLEK